MARKIVVDLALKVLPADHPVYMIRPGSGYHLQEQVAVFKAIAPDFPLLEAPDGTAPFTAPDIDAQISRAIALRTWVRTPARERGVRPTENLDFYRLGHEENAGVRTRLLNAADEILWDLPDQALIFIPSSSLAEDAVSAELGGRNEARVIIPGDGIRAGTSYLGRPLHDVKVFPMRNMPKEVTHPARSPQITFQYEGYARDRLLRAHYGDYQLGNKTAMMEFVSNSSQFDASTMARLTGLTTSIEHFVKSSEFLRPGDLLFRPGGSLSAQVHATINSRGGRLLIEGPQMVPHIMRALLVISLLIQGPVTAQDVAELVASGELLLRNSKAALGDVDVVEATESTLINFAKAAGPASMENLLAGLLESSQLTDGKVDGTADLR